MFVMSKAFTQKLRDVHPALVAVIVHALLKNSKQDFSMIEGVRSLEKQQQNVANGVSQTLNSKHLIQSQDKYGHAVDVCPYPTDWNTMSKFCEIAYAIQKSAKELNVNVRWGGSWDNLTKTSLHPEKLLEDYKNRKLANGEKPFIDAGHFEILI